MTRINLVMLLTTSFILLGALMLPACPAQDPAIPEGCGDEELATSEQCEGFDLRGETCVSQGFEEGTLTCTETCELNTEADCSSCGDFVVSGDEVCDGAGEATCESLGFLGGSLSCESDCSAYRTSGCMSGEVGEPCVDGKCATNAFCLEQLVEGGCVATCDAAAGCSAGEECREVVGTEASVCAPFSENPFDGSSICTPECLVNGCMSCPAPNTCENVSELAGALFGECTAP